MAAWSKVIVIETPAPCVQRCPRRRAFDPAVMEICTIARNINEALGLLAQDCTLPPVAERGPMAFVNVGAQARAMASNQCLPRQFGEYLLF